MLFTSCWREWRPAFGMRRSGVRVPPAGPGARGMLATGRAGATYVPCAGNPHHIRRRAPNARGSTGRERLPTKQEGAGSSPAGRAVSEAEAVEAPGRGPGGSGFESRRAPAVHLAAPAVPAATPAVQRRTPQYPASGSGPIGRGAWLRTRRFRVRVPGAARDDRHRDRLGSPDLARPGRAHWKGGGTT